jgi:hypothetical protein
MDVLIVLTILTRGKLKEKCQILYNFFALSEPEGMLESEHAQMMSRVAQCLKKIGALKRMEVTEDDSSYFAFLARIKDDGKGFHPSLSFQQFFHWIQSSIETSPAFTFVRTINRLLEICLTLDARIDSVTAIISDVVRNTDKEFGVIKPNFPSSARREMHPRVFYISCDTLSLLLPSEGVRGKNLYVQIETIQNVIYPHYQPTKRLQAMRLDQHPQLCCERTVRVPIRRRVFESPPPLGASCPKHPSFRVDIESDLLPDTTYIITFYTAESYFPPVSVKTRPLSSSPSDTRKVR